MRRPATAVIALVGVVAFAGTTVTLGHPYTDIGGALIAIQGAAWFLDVGGSASRIAEAYRCLFTRAPVPTPSWMFSERYVRVSGAVGIFVGMTWGSRGHLQL